MQESVSLPSLQILVNDGSFGFLSSRFGFDFTGPAGQTAIVEASTDLRSWLPLQTNLLSAGPQHFAEPATNPSPRHFYRLTQVKLAPFFR
jgi:hypothetical protein